MPRQVERQLLRSAQARDDQLTQLRYLGGHGPALHVRDIVLGLQVVNIGAFKTGARARGEGSNFAEQVMKYARQFCPPNKAAKAVGRIKRAVQTGWEIPMESALAVERELQQRLFASEDAKEGLAAYVEKRPATFKAK